MKKHILFIDPIEKLTLEKDSSLLLAHTLKLEKRKVYLLFEKDFYILSDRSPVLKVYEFSSQLKQGNFYLDSFSLKKTQNIPLDSSTVFHNRIDPPFDTRYLKYLWMMSFLKKFGVIFVNDPDGILLFNEKMTAFHSHPIHSYVGNSSQGILDFASEMESLGYKNLVLKPLDLYQGIGVKKVSMDNKDRLLKVFKHQTHLYKGSILAQPFIEEVALGEIRATFWKEKPLGAILKVPPKGQFLANLVQGASYSHLTLDSQTEKKCQAFYRDHLQGYGLSWLAYDILNGHINEVNVTCPGLLVETSCALKHNLALEIIEQIG